MKKQTYLALLCTILPFFLTAQVDQLEPILRALSEAIQDVEAKKYSYEQKLSWDDKRPNAITLESSRTSEKGKTNTLVQFFNLKFINPKSIKRDNEKDLLVVKTAIKGKAKYIKNIKDDKIDKYSSEIDIIANDVDNARAIEKLLEQAVEAALEIPSPYTIGESYEEQMNWLTTNVAPLEFGEETIEQKIEREEKQLTRLEFSRISQGKKDSNTETWGFNLIDLDSKKLKLEVEKKKLFVNIETKNKRNYVRYHKNTKLEKYQKSFKIYVPDVEKGKAIVETFKKLAEGSNDRFAAKGVSSLDDLVQTIQIGEDSYEQKVNIEGCILNLTSSYAKKDKTIAEEYIVHLSDLDPRSVEIDVSKRNVYLKSKVRKKQKFVQELENGEPSNFSSEFEIRADGIENARALLAALPTEIEKCKDQNECTPPGGDVASIMKAISNSLGTISIKSTTYEQSLVPVDDNPDQWEYTRIEDKGKKIKEETFIFNLTDLNEKAIDFKIGKQAIGVTLQTNGKEEIIKYLVDDKADDYEKEMEWLVTDISKMRQLICNLEAALNKE